MVELWTGSMHDENHSEGNGYERYVLEYSDVRSADCSGDKTRQ